MEVLFWLGFGVILYTYLGYPMLLGLLVRLKKKTRQHSTLYYEESELPEITLIIACFNEADILEQKIKNTLQLDYPASRRNFYFVTDGSSDNSSEIIYKYPELTLFHENARKGKNAAVNRVM